MYNTKSSMIDMKPKDAIKLDTVALGKTYPEETVLSEDGFSRYFINLAKNMEIKRDKQQTLSGVKIRIYQIVQEPGNHVLYYLQDEPDSAFVREELMHIYEDTQVPLDWVSEWK